MIIYPHFILNMPFSGFKEIGLCYLCEETTLDFGDDYNIRAVFDFFDKFSLSHSFYFVDNRRSDNYVFKRLTKQIQSVYLC